MKSPYSDPSVESIEEWYESGKIHRLIQIAENSGELVMVTILEKIPAGAFLSERAREIFRTCAIKETSRLNVIIHAARQPYDFIVGYENADIVAFHIYTKEHCQLYDMMPGHHVVN